MVAIRQKIVWKSGMCTQNRGLNNLHRKSLIKISDVYTGFVEIGGRMQRRSGIQIVIGKPKYGARVGVATHAWHARVIIVRIPD